MKILLVSLVLGASLAVSARPHDNANNVLGTVDNRTFVTTYANTLVTWNEAKAYCETRGWSMAKITSNAQADLLKSVYNPVNFNGWYWIGAQFDETTKQFMWTKTGEKVESFMPLHILTWSDEDDDKDCLCYSSINHKKGYNFRCHCQQEHFILCESFQPQPLESSHKIPNREELDFWRHDGDSNHILDNFEDPSFETEIENELPYEKRISYENQSSSEESNFLKLTLV
ncbi:unnamed protein product [Orchesella dallaii]|uniref:C-type lectin domain-containing protein n=1 Tax=Orchesella dallaii TaxID=48710 RepID=A0ABP1PIQ8_9HEXA